MRDSVKKTVHIISHSHLDREWYMPFEAHRMRVVELLDAVLELFETDPEFKYFHLDGQTIPLDDYLEVKPNERERLQRAISSGQLRIGPFYILQDAFLISEEANVRNALIGKQECAKWQTKGEPIGYFPDTFGLSAQIPQLIKRMNMQVAAFGRGVKPTGFNNTVSQESAYQSVYSEMYWQSPNHEEVLGILFANWYSNGNEIPVEEEKVRKFWDKKLKDVEQYAATSQLLMMNGCDHQPVQKNLSKAIAVAQKLYPEYHFVHSNFEDYIQAIQKEKPEQISTIQGELRSQETDGWYTLANTASSRIDLKQWSHRLALKLEQVIEPLCVLAEQYGFAYPAEQLDFAWKCLLQNYPHDSICGCSVDSVHRGMKERFERVEAILNYIERELHDFLQQLTFEQSVVQEGILLTIWNTAFQKRAIQATQRVEIARCPFNQAAPSACYEEMAAIELKPYKVVDINGKEVICDIRDLGVVFEYDLPKDGFRIPYMARMIEVTVHIPEVEALSYQPLYLVESSSNKIRDKIQFESDLPNSIENAYIRLTVNETGTLDVVQLKTGKQLTGQGIMLDTGDSGNEYIFKAANGEKYTSKQCLKAVTIEQQKCHTTMHITYEWQLPISADAQLDDERRRVIDVTQRKSGRHKNKTVQQFTVSYTLRPDDDKVWIKIKGENTVKDHRLQMLFQIEGEEATHWADSHYELIERCNTVSKQWKNPTNPQVMRHAVAIQSCDTNQAISGITVATNGLYEYEVIATERVTQLGITVLRCTGELGDWGYFPTPEAQEIREFEAELTLKLWQGEGERQQTLIEARHYYVPTTFVSNLHKMNTPLPLTTAHISSEMQEWLNLARKKRGFVVTALKAAQDSTGWIIRGVNLSSECVSLTQTTERIAEVNLLEEPIETNNEDIISQPNDITTIKYTKEEGYK